MYKKFFGLRENPFNVSPDPRYLFVTPHTEEALSCLTYGIQRRKGFVLLSGEVGTGKTTLINKLLEWLHREGHATAFIFNPRLSEDQFFEFMMADFGIECDVRSKTQILLRLNQWLLERYRAGETAALIVDEAQNLSPVVLEEIRLLTNFETYSEKLLQIILSGQPELDMKLRQPELRQLRQRITVRAKTYPLTEAEAQGYITSRLRIAGSDGQTIFSPEAIAAIYRYSGGIPRVVNVLCEHALIGAFADQRKPVTAEIVRAVAEEFEFTPAHPGAADQSGPAQGESSATEASHWTALMDRLRRPE